MIIWGSGNGHAAIGAAGVGHCDNCNAVRSFNYGLNYRYAHLYYWCSWLTKRSYVKLCSVCDKGAEVTRAEALSNGGKEAIPFLRRWGWAALVAVVGIGVVGGFMLDAQNRQHVTEEIADPHVGDILVMDLAKVTDSFEGRHSYGLAKITEVKPDGIAVITAGTAYDRLRDASRDLRTQAYADADYFDADETIRLSSTRLVQLRDAGAIEDAKR